jgi:hypothetical protein
VSQTVVIRSPSQLGRIAWAGRTRPVRILLRIPSLPSQETQLWEERLNRQLEDCGCSMGAKFAATGLMGGFIWQIHAHAISFASWPYFLLRVLLTVFGFGIVGKFIGTSLARLRLARAAKQLSSL